jgi:hypothetical protein
VGCHLGSKDNNQFGWAVEMRIPYAAALFRRKKQTWGLNFGEIQRDNQQYSWNFIDSKLGTFTQQNGTLEESKT